MLNKLVCQSFLAWMKDLVIFLGCISVSDSYHKKNLDDIISWCIHLPISFLSSHTMIFWLLLCLPFASTSSSQQELMTNRSYSVLSLNTMMETELAMKTCKQIRLQIQTTILMSFLTVSYHSLPVLVTSMLPFVDMFFYSCSFCPIPCHIL